MNKAKGWCKAIVILPLTAGNCKNEMSNKYILHDGSISGLIMLTSLVVILAEVMYICNSFQEKSKTAPDISRPLLILLSCLGIGACVSVSIREHIRKRYILDVKSHNKSKSLKLKFLCLFFLGCVVYRILKIALHIECKVYVRLNDSFGLAIAYDISCLLFYMVQTCFIYYFYKYRFVKSLFTFYALIIIVVTNISTWTYKATWEHDLSTVSTENTTFRCLESNSSFSVGYLFQNARPFTEPMLSEYPLLSLLFLSGIWPRTTNTTRDIEENSDEPFEESEMTTLLKSQRSTSCRPDAVARRIGVTLCIILISGIICLPGLVIYVLRINGNLGEDFFWISFAITSILEDIILLIALVICFHAVQHQCRPCKEKTSFEIGHVLLILSFIITTGYFTLHLMTQVHPIARYQSSLITADIFKIIIMYLQTVYILQMTKYTITSSRSRYLSVQYTCLLIGLINFGFWISDTFLAAPYIYKFRDPAYYSGFHIENTEIFWFPFVIFYRFECFICFYSLYTS